MFRLACPMKTEKLCMVFSVAAGLVVAPPVQILYNLFNMQQKSTPYV